MRGGVPYLMAREDTAWFGYAAYERGVGLYRQCRSALDQAELRVRQIIDPNDLDGAPRFDPDTP